VSEGLETSRASLIKRWREIVDLGILSVGREWNEGYCQCDPSVGMAPCHYCAEHAAILAGEKMLAEIERLREECGCYEGMKEGFAIRIADAKRERDECRRLLLQVADEWDRLNRNKPGNRPITPIVLLREWREAARAAGGWK